MGGRRRPGRGGSLRRRRGGAHLQYAVCVKEEQAEEGLRQGRVSPGLMRNDSFTRRRSCVALPKRPETGRDQHGCSGSSGSPRFFDSRWPVRRCNELMCTGWPIGRVMNTNIQHVFGDRRVKTIQNDPQGGGYDGEVECSLRHLRPHLLHSVPTPFGPRLQSVRHASLTHTHAVGGGTHDAWVWRRTSSA